jgi:tetratricopeptide (TPR) repeat protein
MTIQDRDRKILWGRSGNRCAICKQVLVEDGTAFDRESVTGQEAHIVSRSTGGPRGRSVVDDVDAYQNLILLCPRHHKIVDDRPWSHLVDDLVRIKADHEAWVSRSLDGLKSVGPAHVDLPALPERLVNRDRELAAITEVMERAAGMMRASVVIVTGMHGVGKSALCAHWVLRNRQHFAGGQLVADFSKRRHGGGVDLGEILGDFLRELGTSDDAIPATLRARRRMFLDATAGRKLLMLLDDADHAAQVSAVLPAGAGSVVVVTSNHHLEEVLYDGASLVTVDPLDDETSLRLLADTVNADRLDAEPDAVDRLIGLCGGLPIALRVCGARLVGRDRARSVSSVVVAIEAAEDRLGAVSGTGHHAVDAIFDFAYQDLPAEARLTYRRLGLHPDGDLALSAVSALVGGPVAAVAGSLRSLEDAHLVEVADGDRYRMHALVRAHARVCARRYDTLDVTQGATGRLVDWFIAALQLADRAVFDDRLRLADFDLRNAPNLPTFGSARDAFDWFGRERAVIAGLIRVAVDAGWDARVWRLAEPLWPLVYNEKTYSLWFEAHEAGALAGERLGDDAVVARMRSCLARAFSDQADFGRAVAEMRAASDAADRCMNARLRASVTEFGAIMRFERGDLVGALDGFRDARALNVACRRLRGVAIQDYQIGKCLIAMGAAERALQPLEAAYQALVSLGDQVIAGRVLRRQGEALLGLGRYTEARASLAIALDAAARTGARFDEAQTLEALAAVADHEVEPDTARASRAHAYAIYSELGHPRARSVFMSLDAVGAS